MKRVLSLLLLVMMVSCTHVLSEELPAYVEEIGKYGIIQGDPGGNIRLSDALTRAEAVTMLVRLYGFKPETSAAASVNTFYDMEGHWAANAAMIALQLGICEGDEKGNFKAGEKIKAEDFIKMAIILLGYEPGAERRGGYPMGYLVQASQLGVTNGLSIEAGGYITRDDASKILYRCLDTPLMVVTGYAEEVMEYTVMDGMGGRELQTVRTKMLQDK